MSTFTRGSRRNNAPIRPRRRAGSVPDLLIAMAVAGWVMAGVFLGASFFDNDVTVGEAGKILARMFAAALAVTSLFSFLLGLVLLRDERALAEHYLAPIAIGAIVGALAATLFLQLQFGLMFVPFLLFIFVVRPVRRRLFGGSRTRRGHQG